MGIDGDVEASRIAAAMQLLQAGLTDSIDTARQAVDAAHGSIERAASLLMSGELSAVLVSAPGATAVPPTSVAAPDAFALTIKMSADKSEIQVTVTPDTTVSELRALLLKRASAPAHARVPAARAPCFPSSAWA